LDARLGEDDPDGTPVLLAIYDHPYYAKRIGLRRRLTDHMRATEDCSREQALAEEIAVYEISEPLGAYFDLLVEDSAGVWWWGDGYPELPQPR
jgi:hypothetical protein